MNRDVHQLALMERAPALGIEVVDLAPVWGCDAVRYQRGDQRELVFNGRRYSSLSAQAAFICDQKHATKAVLRELGVPVPPGVHLHHLGDARQAVLDLLERFSEVVCKPADGTHGDGVATGLTDYRAVRAHWRRIADNPGGVVIEAQVPGDDLRLQAVGGRLVAACRREPAHVFGDGRSTVAELVEARDEQCRSQNPNNRLVLGDDGLALLDAQGLGVDDVPAGGRRVRLSNLNNISLGGLPVDVTDELHPSYAEWVARIGAELGIRIFSVDIMTTDHRSVPSSACVLEVNARPEWLHHTFSDRRVHDIPGLILADLFGLA